MKKNLFLVAFCTFFLSTTVLADSRNPENITLDFGNRQLILNFEENPELLSARSENMRRYTRSFYSQSRLKNARKKISNREIYHFLRDQDIIYTGEKEEGVEITQDENGQVHFSGRPGGITRYIVDEEKLASAINAAIMSGQTTIKVQAKAIEPKLKISDDLQEQGVKEIIAIGESNFEGSSSARIKNILNSIEILNGTLIPAGHTFSFNQALGPVSGKTGFFKESVIKGNTMAKEFGGGVCQVSTTVFRAAFYGGLPITERREHSYAVPYYKPYGLDATVYIGAPDVKFVNDTPGAILIQTYTQGDDLIFVFYGTNDGRSVSAEGPVITNVRTTDRVVTLESEDLMVGEEGVIEAVDGFHTEWVRKVNKNGEIESDIFTSDYRPWPKHVYVGIATEKPEIDEPMEDLNESSEIVQTETSGLVYEKKLVNTEEADMIRQKALLNRERRSARRMNFEKRRSYYRDT